MMERVLYLAIALAAFALPPAARAQAAPPAASTTSTFDVASITPSKPDEVGIFIRPNPNNFKTTNASLKYLIMSAYNLHDIQIQSSLPWMDSARFDIIAKTDNPSVKQGDYEAQHKLMQVRLQALLVDRFKLRVHTDMKQMAIYTLVTAKDGPKLTKSTENTGLSMGRGYVKCSAFSASQFADVLTNVLDRIVVDHTGLTGDYTFTLKWNPVEAEGGDADLPDLFTAIQEQLGLKLQKDKGPVEVLLVDSAEKPSEN